MRSLLLSILLLLVAGLQRAHAQTYWARDLGGAGNDHIADVKTDASGAVYITGEFSGTAQIAGQTLVSAGGQDLFVAKLTADGNATWCVRGGGAGVDRGLKLAVGTNGTVAVVGDFMGAATFFGTPLNSAGGTADMVLAVLDASTGALQWIAQGGSATGTDRPFGVSVSTTGKVAVTGEFSGSAQWGSVTLNATGAAPDAFVASYSAAGVVEWVKQGQAPDADRGIDVVHDASGALYVTGQFSNAITFDQVHANDLLNATFLLKLDAAGNEVWFRRCGGAVFNHVRDLLLTNAGDVLLTGDVQGNMLFFDDASDLISSAAPYAYYLLKVNAAGQLVSQTTVGSTDPLTVGGIDVRSDTVSVLGAFNCRFSGLADLYDAEGLFMAVGEEDLFVSRHRLGTLALVQGQQFGGRKGKSAGQVSTLPNGELVFCGSFEKNIIFPQGDVNMQADLQPGALFFPPEVPVPYCGDEAAGRFAADTSLGANDGFVARAYVKGRSPYDFWHRYEEDCSYPEEGICISRNSGGECLDSISNCGGNALRVKPNWSFSSSLGAHYVGPEYDVLWSTGSTSSNVTITGTGWYWARITTRNGCFSWKDSIYVETLPLPPVPLVSDDVPFNTNTLIPIRVDLCEPDSAWLWGTPAAGTTYHWIALETGDTTFSDSIHVWTTGGYRFEVTNALGCTRSSTMIVVVSPLVPMPALDVEIVLSYPQDIEGNDSLMLCGNELLQIAYTPTWYVDGVPANFPEDLLLLNRFNGNQWGLPPDPGAHFGQIDLDEPGWQEVTFDFMVLNSPCGEDTLFFTRTDSVWVGEFPSSDVSVAVVGEHVMCPGDTLLLEASCTGCDTILWSGPNILQRIGDNILVIQAGTYQATALLNDTNGCNYSSQQQHAVSVQQGPVLDLEPSNGIICPGSSAVITSSQTGVEYHWVGPAGPISGDGPSISSNVPGEYYLVLITDMGCEFVSDEVSLANYATPFLNASPVPMLCEGGPPVTLQVISAAAGGVQWSAPLVGSSMTQTVTQPGTYNCTVTACGITTQLSVTIGTGGAEVELLTPGPFQVCPGEQVTLQAAAGQPGYTWLPGGGTGPVLVTDDAGQYVVIADDGLGCTDTSEVVVVTNIAFSQPLISAGASICWGQDALLQVIGSGSLTWYLGGEVVSTSDELTVIQPADTTTYLVTQEENGCTSLPYEVVVNVTPVVSPYTITAPTSLCAGEPFTITLSGDPALEVVWQTPAGTVEGPLIVIDPSTPDDGGTYIAQPMLGPCRVASRQVLVDVHAPMQLPWNGDTILCTGGSLNFTIPADYTDPLWSNGSEAHHLEVTAGGTYSVEVIDPQGCPVSAVVNVSEIVCELEIPNVITPNGDGINDEWLITGGFVSGTMQVFNRWGNAVFTGELFKKSFRGKDDGGNLLTDGVYYYVITLEKHGGGSQQVAGYVQILR